MRRSTLLLITTLLPACGDATLAMSQAGQSGLSYVTVEPDAGTPSTVSDAGEPTPTPEPDAGQPVLDAGTPTPTSDAGPTPECEPGMSQACTTACGSTGIRTCVSEHWSPCTPPTEVCTNGADDDCDGRVDVHDPECPPEVRTCESEDGNGCNGDLGYGDHCAPADNTNGCSATRFNAWCNRRNPEFPNIWHEYVSGWVDSRCDGALAETGTQYSTWFCLSSENIEYRCTTPLVLSFDGAAVRTVRGDARFAFTPGRPVRSDWPSVATPWLVRDVNGNGRIDDGSELFGSNTRTERGVAKHGFEALAALDENRDGVLDAKDAAWGSLRLWRDRNGDRVSQADELTTVTKEGVTSLSVRYETKPRCDARGNCERERSSFTWRGGKGAVVDLYLRLN